MREALNRLAAEGFVVSELHRGAKVVRADEARVKENHLIRAALEPLAIELALPRLTQADFDELMAINNEIAQHESVDPALSPLNRKFHMRLYEVTGSPLLLMMLAHLWRALGGGPRVNRPVHESVAQHAAILEALRQGDGAQAAALTREHILGAELVLEYPKR